MRSLWARERRGPPWASVLPPAGSAAALWSARARDQGCTSSQLVQQLGQVPRPCTHPSAYLLCTPGPASAPAQPRQPLIPPDVAFLHPLTPSLHATAAWMGLDLGSFEHAVANRPSGASNAAAAVEAGLVSEGGGAASAAGEAESEGGSSGSELDLLGGDEDGEWEDGYWSVAEEREAGEEGLWLDSDLEEEDEGVVSDEEDEDYVGERRVLVQALEARLAAGEEGPAAAAAAQALAQTLRQICSRSDSMVPAAAVLKVRWRRRGPCPRGRRAPLRLRQAGPQGPAADPRR